MFKRLLVLVAFLFLVACKEPEVNFVFIVNNLDAPVEVRAQFAAENDQANELVFSLAPGERDGWRYTLGGQSDSQLDQSFRSMLIKSNACEIFLDRNQLETVARQNGAWSVSIRDELLRCDA